MGTSKKGAYRGLQTVNVRTYRITLRMTDYLWYGPEIYVPNHEFCFESPSVGTTRNYPLKRATREAESYLTAMRKNLRAM
jgi:hypothetical protein